MFSTIDVKQKALFAIVPVKELDISKERLSAELSPQERQALTVAMLKDVLNALKSSTIHEVLIVSADPTVRKIAIANAVSHIFPKLSGLNPSLDEAIEWCTQKKAGSVLIIPADIPLITPEDINKLIALGSENETVVLSPSLDGGTNALFSNPPRLISACFGPDSFFTHLREAIEKDATVRFYSSKGIMLDVDSEEDLNRIAGVRREVRGKHVLNQIALLRK